MRTRHWLFRWMTLVLSLTSVTATRAQAPAFSLTLPVLYRQIPDRSGTVVAVTSSRVAPQLKLAVVDDGDYARSAFELMLSTDGGLSWVTAESQPWQAQPATQPGWWGDMLSPRIVELGGSVTVAVLPVWMSQPVLYLSTDFGQSWISRNLPRDPACPEVTVSQVVTTPAAPARILVSAVCQGTASDPGLLETSDGGLTWTFLDPWTPTTPDWIQDPAGSSLNADLLYRRSDGNWLRTFDFGVHWDYLSIPGDVVRLSPNDDQILLGITSSDGFGMVSADGGETWHGWRHLPCVNTDFSFSATPIWLRGPAETLIVTCGEGLLIRSRDLGLTWEAVTLPGGAPQFLVAADDALPNTLYVQTGSPLGSTHFRLYRSEDGGDNWQDVLALTRK